MVFAGSGRLQRRKASLNGDRAEGAVCAQGRVRAREIEVVRHYDQQLPRIQVDPLLLHQVFLNVMMNAEQAVAATGRPGRIEIATKFGREERLVDRDASGHRAGHLSDDTLPRIFEPFYTTKDVGKGAGWVWRWRTESFRSTAAGSRRPIILTEAPSSPWNCRTDRVTSMIDETFLTTEEVLEYLQVNLRTVYRLIKAGKIPAVRVGRQWRFRKSDIDAWLDSQRPAAARVAADDSHADPAPRRRTTSPTRARASSSWTTKPSIRDLLAKTLALAEYDVDVAADGRSALDRLRHDAYDLLIADLKMPGIDGLSVIREAKRYKADLPVIIITGYSTESSAIEAVNLGVVGLPDQAVPRPAGARGGCEGPRGIGAGPLRVVICTLERTPDVHSAGQRSTCRAFRPAQVPVLLRSQASVRFCVLR